ncbi:MAG: MCE family protein [Flavobacteriaceae bacterium]|nr:MCE family protein [Flavobacteriaceae bacterium]
MKLSREVKTGIFAIVSILLFILGYNFLKGTELFNKPREFYVAYDNVGGLVLTAPVTVNGLKVGKVKEIYLANNKGGKVIVKFEIEKDFQFSKTSIVKIYSSGLISGNNLGIIPDYSSKEMAQPNDTLKGQIDPGMVDGLLEKFDPLEKSISSTLIKLDSVLGDLDQVMDNQTKVNLRESIAKLNTTMASFNGAAANLNSLLATNKDKLNNTFTNLETTTENFSQFSDSLAQLETGKMMKELQGTISKFNAIASQIENGEGSVGKLLKDEQLYNNLEGASRQLEQLLQDLKLNPKRYVHFSLFGKKAKVFNPPTEPEQ